MVKIKGPLLSHEAHGSISKTITYSKRRSGSQCRKYNKPGVAATPTQRGQRRLTDFLTAQWRGMTDAQKAAWETNAKAASLNLRGYHYFLQQAQRRLYTHHGLALYLSCNKIVNGNVLDISGQGYHGSLGPSYPSNSPVQHVGMNIKMSNCLYFDGSDDYVDVGDKSKLNFGLGDFTICLLTYNEAKAAPRRPLAKVDYVDAHQGYMFDWTDDDYAIWILGNGTSDISTEYYTVEQNKWVSHVLRRVGSTVDCFKNGVHITSREGGNLNVNNSNGFTIGTDSWHAQPYKGKIDEICAYARGLTNTEILKRYQFAITKV